MKSNFISQAWLSLVRADQIAHHRQLYQLKLFSTYANSIGSPEPSHFRTEVSYGQWICFKFIRLKTTTTTTKYTCVSSFCNLSLWGMLRWWFPGISTTKRSGCLSFKRVILNKTTKLKKHWMLYHQESWQQDAETIPISVTCWRLFRAL